MTKTQNNNTSLIAFAESVGGTFSAKQALGADISNTTLFRAVKQGKVERIARGVYALPYVFEDEYVVYQSKYKRGIYSLNTALFLLNLTDRTPNRLSMTFPKSYNVTNPIADGLDIHRVEEKYYNIGIDNVRTKTGNTVRAYNAERTICEILKPVNKIDIQIIKDAVTMYLKSNQINITLLTKYARMFKVYDKLHSYMEVLL